MEWKFGEFSESDKLQKHEFGSIQSFLLVVSCGSVATFWSLTQEVAGLNNPFNHKLFCEFSKNI